MPTSDLEDLLDDTERDSRARLEAYSVIRAGMVKEYPYAEHGRYWEATIRAGELAAQAQLAWATETRSALVEVPAT
jgi:hypothetical protein